MPQGIVPIYSRRTSPPRTRRLPTLSSGVRLSTLLHRSALDRQIASGAQTHRDPRLALRERQLTAPSQRERIARTIDSMLEHARTLPVPSSRVPLRRDEIGACADDFVALARRLRDGNAIDAQGVVMTIRLLSDGASPLYYRRSPVSLRYAVRSARLALEPVPASTPAVSSDQVAVAA